MTKLTSAILANVQVVTVDTATGLGIVTDLRRGKGVIADYGIYPAPKSRNVIPLTFHGIEAFAVYTSGINPKTGERRSFVYFLPTGEQFNAGDKVLFARVGDNAASVAIANSDSGASTTARSDDLTPEATTLAETPSEAPIGPKNAPVETKKAARRSKKAEA